MFRVSFLSMLMIAAASASAIEIDGEASAGRDFLYLDANARHQLADGRAALGAGVAVVSDYQLARAGLELVADALGDWWSTGVTGGFAPRQQGRGWVWLDPHGSLHLDRERWSIEGELGLKLRRADAGLKRETITIDQMQLHAEGRLELHAWTLAVRAFLSFYDPDLSRYGAFDTSVFISVADRPERWAVLVDAGRKLPRRVHLEAGVGAVGYADGRGVALVPRAALKAGPFAGVTPGISVEVVLSASGAPSPRPIGGFTLEYER